MKNFKAEQEVGNLKGGNPVLYGFIITAPEMNIGTIMGQMDAPVPLFDNSLLQKVSGTAALCAERAAAGK